MLTFSHIRLTLPVFIIIFINECSSTKSARDALKGNHIGSDWGELLTLNRKIHSRSESIPELRFLFLVLSAVFHYTFSFYVQVLLCIYIIHITYLKMFQKLSVSSADLTGKRLQVNLKQLSGFPCTVCVFSDQFDIVYF